MRRPIGLRTKKERLVNGYGYVLVLMPEHPSSSIAGYVLEHRLVMERALGRPLEPFETVHHLNGIRSDNRLENLELWARITQPSGQRVKDLVSYASQILALYGDPNRSSVDNVCTSEECGDA